ncbi:MAG TPA: hypothetical protein DCQ06_09730, partial [Myxococcales bacterium]|nr:hypothetical protein [Myxococcales bacterium]HAN31863.1 hypothetical protein [Myxococcales bacterium]
MTEAWDSDPKRGGHSRHTKAIRFNDPVGKSGLDAAAGLVIALPIGARVHRSDIGCRVGLDAGSPDRMSDFVEAFAAVCIGSSKSYWL